MALPLDPRERHKAWTDQQAIADADAANRRALRDAVVAYEDAGAGPSAPVWQDPDAIAVGTGGGAMDYDSQAGLDKAIQGMETDEDAQIRRNLGGGEPGHMDIAGAAALRGAGSDAEAGQLVDLLLQGRNVPSSPNPLRPIREQYARDVLGDGSTTTELDAAGNVVERPAGLLNDEHWYTQQMQGAQVEQQRGVAAAYGQEAARQQAEIDAMEYKAQRDAQRRNDAIRAEQHVMAKVTAAADRLNEAPDIDPNRYWASQSAGRKALWAIQAALAGFAGLNPTAALETAIGMDIDAQKSNFAQKQAGFNARSEEMGRSRNVYQDIRESINDEDIADQAMRLARGQWAETAFKAMATKEGIPVQIAEQNLFLTELRKRNADIWKNISEQLAATPERIGGGFRSALAPFQRKVLEGELKDARSRGAKMGELAVTEGGAAAREQVKAQAELGKKQMDDDLQERKFQFEQRAKMVSGEKMQSVAAALKAGESYLGRYGTNVPGRSEGSIAGRGFTVPWNSEEQQQERAQLDTFVQWAATALTGANVSERQEQFFDRVLRGENLSGDQIRAGMRMTMEALEAVRMANERALEPKAQANYRGVDESRLPTLDPLVGGRTRRGTAEEDAAELGGTLR